MLVLLAGTGILMTALTGFFQVSHVGHWFKTHSAESLRTNMLPHFPRFRKNRKNVPMMCSDLLVFFKEIS